MEPHGQAGDILILGIGNDLLGDDAAGVLAASSLGGLGAPVEITTRSGLALLDAIVGFRRVLLLDSQATGLPPGQIAEFELTASEVRSPSNHYLSYGEALAIGEAVGVHLPDEIRVLAIERWPEVTFGDGLSDPVRAALPALVSRGRDILRNWVQQNVAA